MYKNYKKLVLVSCLFALLVVALGAYTRLSDAGLGCPDWPGCYGFLTVPKKAEDIAKANAAFPTLDVEHGKAWKEMIHRYVAGTLGLLILAIFIRSVMIRRHRLTPVKLPLILCLLVLFQAFLGMLTVTMQLQPMIVMGHLLGGFSIISCLYLLYLRLRTRPIIGGDAGAKPYSFVALIMLLLVISQIALGGWLAANYSASHCIDLPLCGANTFERFSFWEVFQLPHEQETYEYGVLSAEARMSIHLLHRIWAIVTAVVLIVGGIKILSSSYSSTIKSAIYWVWAFLVCQILLGVTLVWLSFPLFVALAHNLVALCLLLSVVRLTYLIKTKC